MEWERGYKKAGPRSKDVREDWPALRKSPASVRCGSGLSIGQRARYR